MNPLSNVRFIKELNQREIRLGIKESSSWHNEYKDSAWVFIGGLPFELTEGDILAVFSQYGEIVNINLVRDKGTGKSKGYCFLCFEDQRSTILTVDNLNGIKLCKRTIRVDHVANYRMPKDHEDTDEVTLKLRAEGCAPAMPSAANVESESDEAQPPLQHKKHKKMKTKAKIKKQKKKKKKHSKNKGGSSSSSGTEHTADPDIKPVIVKKEKDDPGYRKYENGQFGRQNVIDAGSNDRRAEAKGPFIHSGDRHPHTETSRVREKDLLKASNSDRKRESKTSHTSKQNESFRQDNKLERRSFTPDRMSSTSASPPSKRKGQHTMSGSADRTQSSRHNVSGSRNKTDKSRRSGSVSPDRSKFSARRKSVSPPVKHKTYVKGSRSPERSRESVRRNSHAVRRVSRSLSPEDRNYDARQISRSPLHKPTHIQRESKKRRASRSPVPNRLSRTSVSPLVARKGRAHSRTSRSPPPKLKSDYEKDARRAPSRIQDSFRRNSRSPSPKRRVVSQHKRSHSPDRMRDSRHKMSPSMSRKPGSSRHVSRSSSPDVRSKYTSSARSPNTKYDSRDHKRRTR